MKWHYFRMTVDRMVSKTNIFFFLNEKKYINDKEK